MILVFQFIVKFKMKIEFSFVFFDQCWARESERNHERKEKIGCMAKESVSLDREKREKQHLKYFYLFSTLIFIVSKVRNFIANSPKLN